MMPEGYIGCSFPLITYNWLISLITVRNSLHNERKSTEVLSVHWERETVRPPESIHVRYGKCYMNSFFCVCVGMYVYAHMHVCVHTWVLRCIFKCAVWMWSPEVNSRWHFSSTTHIFHFFWDNVSNWHGTPYLRMLDWLGQSSSDLPVFVSSVLILIACTAMSSFYMWILGLNSEFCVYKTSI